MANFHVDWWRRLFAERRALSQFPFFSCSVSTFFHRGTIEEYSCCAPAPISPRMQEFQWNISEKWPSAALIQLILSCQIQKLIWYVLSIRVHSVRSASSNGRWCKTRITNFIFITNNFYDFHLQRMHLLFNKRRIGIVLYSERNSDYTALGS